LIIKVSRKGRSRLQCTSSEGEGVRQKKRSRKKEATTEKSLPPAKKFLLSEIKLAGQLDFAEEGKTRRRREEIGSKPKISKGHESRNEDDQTKSREGGQLGSRAIRSYRDMRPLTTSKNRKRGEQPLPRIGLGHLRRVENYRGNAI